MVAECCSDRRHSLRDWFLFSGVIAAIDVIPVIKKGLRIQGNNAGPRRRPASGGSSNRSA